MTKAMDHAEDCRDEKQRRHRGEEQPANNGAAERRILFSTFSQADRHREHSNDHRQSGHQDRSESREPCLHGRFDCRASCGQSFFREADHQDAVGSGYSNAHDRSRKGGHADRRAGYKQEPNDSRERRRKAGQNNEWVEPRLKIHDNKEVNQNDGEYEPGQQSQERRLHRLNLAAHDDL